MNDGIISVAVEAVAVRGPGLVDWTAAGHVLRGATTYRSEPIMLDPPAQLSPAERRRAIPSVKLALGLGAASVAASGLDPSGLPAVFASSGADGETIVAILSALATPAREVSPTRFHNSVHNAPSGYWGIAARSREAVSSVSGYDDTFAAGLLEAGVQAVSNERPVLLVASDLPYPAPLDAVRRIEAGFGVAFLVTPAPTDRSLATLRMTFVASGQVSFCADPDLEALRRGNPAAHALPMLVLLANRTSGSVRLSLGHGGLDVQVSPC